MSKYTIAACEQFPYGEFNKELFEADVAAASEHFYSHYTLDYLFSVLMDKDHYHQDNGGVLTVDTFNILQEANEEFPSTEAKEWFIKDFMEERFDRRIRRDLFGADVESFDDAVYVKHTIHNELIHAWKFVKPAIVKYPVVEAA